MTTAEPQVAPVPVIDVSAVELPRDRWSSEDATAQPLAPAVEQFLRDRFGGQGAGVPARAEAARAAGLAAGAAAGRAEASGSRLPAQVVAELNAALGSSAAAVLSLNPSARRERATGMSYLDLLARQSGELPLAPDAVLQPRDHDQVMAVLRVCSDAGVAVVPFGGGTSVVGGVTADLRDRPFVSLDTSRMNRLVEVNPIDLTARVGPGITGPQLERLLEVRGLCWGHVPQSWERASIGGYLATRSSGQASAGYGRSTSTAVGLRVATPVGGLDLGRGPDSAAGPDLMQLFLGSEGALGVITEATLQVRHAPEAKRYEAVLLPTFARALGAVREIVQRRVSPDVLRLSDPDETEASLRMSGPTGKARTALERYLELRGVDEGCMLILGWEDTREQVSRRRDAVKGILKEAGAVSLGQRVGKSWEHGRFSGPRMRDALMAHGYLVETLETATTWSGLPRLREAISTSLRGSLARTGEPFVMSHVSHTYSSGASLYVTVLAPVDADDPMGQWRTAKAAVTEALMAEGATLSHHHAVGRDHAPWYPQEVGELGVRSLAAVKSELDPAGILNPGVLIPA